MAKLTHRCSALELQHLIEAIYPEERRHLFTDWPWQGEGFRHWLNPKVICIEHYMPKNKPIKPGAFSGHGRKPAA